MLPKSVGQRSLIVPVEAISLEQSGKRLPATEPVRNHDFLDMIDRFGIDVRRRVRQRHDGRSRIVEPEDRGADSQPNQTRADEPPSQVEE